MSKEEEEEGEGGGGGGRTDYKGKKRTEYDTGGTCQAHRYAEKQYFQVRERKLQSVSGYADKNSESAWKKFKYTVAVA